MPAISFREKPSFLAPEVVQTSQMDCGPAVLKCIIEGFGGRASYGRLREACQTDIDGTSIDTLEEVAGSLGLDAVQIQEPLDHLLLPSAKNLPAILVVKKTTGLHFIVAWRRVGPFVQLMDPASGRSWIRAEKLLEETYEHDARIPASVWRSYAGSEDFQSGLATRLRAFGIDPRGPLAEANADPTWVGLAALDASIRATSALVRAGAHRGAEAGRLLARIFAAARERDDVSARTICPDVFWSTRLDESQLDEESGGEDEAQLIVRGAVLVRIGGPTTHEQEDTSEGGDADAEGLDGEEQGASKLSPELQVALTEASPRPLRHAWARMMRSDSATAIALITGLVVLAAAGFVQALLVRGMLDVGRRLNGPWQQFAGAASVVLFLLLLAAIEAPAAAAARALGRRLETMLRMDLLAKIPRLADHYFRSRPRGDMASRGHGIHSVRVLPQLAAGLLRTTLAFSVATGALAWIDPRSITRVLGMSGLILLIPFAGATVLSAREQRVQTHAGALLSFYLDAMLGLLPLRSHGAETALLREFDASLLEWRNSLESRRVAGQVLDGLQRLASAATAIWIVSEYIRRASDPRTLLLMLYWSLMLPSLASQLSGLLAQIPLARTAMLRMLEPLGAPEEEIVERAHDGADGRRASRGMDIAFTDVTARVGGNTVLSGLNLQIRGGEHVAIVGQSGAGKSTLLGLLLGWNRVSEGRVEIDGETLDASVLRRLRHETAWLDPEVHLWNRSLISNLEFGALEPGQSFNEVLDRADLLGVIERLRDGMQTLLGEGGVLVSGGEGQRVRLARALRRRDARLVLIDEGFRGLDRHKRSVLLERAREVWSAATVLCVTHDIDLAMRFPRVIIVEDGQVIEDGNPVELASKRKSRLFQMAAAEREQQQMLRNDPLWRRIRVERGRVVEDEAGGERD